MGIFQGHQIIAILADIAWPAFWLLLLYAFELPKIGRKMNFWSWFYLYTILLLAPNAMYAVFEVKHLIFIDGVGDILNIWSYLVFGGVSLFGVVTSIIGTRRLISHYAANTNRVILLVLLSVAMGFGGAAGLLDFLSLPAIIFPPALIIILIDLISHPFYLTVGAVASGLFFLVNIILDFFQPT